MAQRKYFKYRIEQLEEIYTSAGDDCGLLEELEEELHHRSTKRAKQLLARVEKCLEANTPTLAQPHTKERNPEKPNSPKAANVSEPPYLDNDDPIDWDVVLSGTTDQVSNANTPQSATLLSNAPEDILDTWIVLEALSPQSYKRPDDLVVGNGSVAYIREGHEPWFKGEKSRPKANLYYLVYLGAINLENATEKLLKQYQDKRIERPNVKGQAALGVVILNKKGVPVQETGLTLSSFGWAYARALEGKLE